MSRVLLAVLLAVLSLGAVSCSKPTADDCRKAVLNMQRVRGLDTSNSAPDVEAFVRKCRATGDPTSVHCLMAAKDVGEINRCEGGAK